MFYMKPSRKLVHEPRRTSKATRRKFLLYLRYTLMAFFIIWFFLLMANLAYPAPDYPESQTAYNLACTVKLVADYDHFATDAGCKEAERVVEFITSSSYIDNAGNRWQYQWTLVDPALPKRDAGDTGGSARGDTT